MSLEVRANGRRSGGTAVVNPICSQVLYSSRVSSVAVLEEWESLDSPLEHIDSTIAPFDYSSAISAWSFDQSHNEMITQLSKPRDYDILFHHSSSMEESSLLVEVDIKIEGDIVEACLRLNF